MISTLSDAEYLMKRSPHPRDAFFEQAVLDQNLSQRLLELPGFSLELFDFVRGCLTRRVASQSLLAGLQKLLRPTVIEVLVDAFLAAKLSYADLSAKPLQNNADLLLGRMMPACGSANISDSLLGAVRCGLACLSHRRSP
jgi:hypothetical protein